jgi:DNA modification methylase
MLPEWWTNLFGNTSYVITDCIDAMKKMPSKSVDLILTDPPYGTNFGYGVYSDTRENLIELIKNFIPEVLRIGKVVLLTCGYQNMRLYPEPDHIMIWSYYPGDWLCSWGFNCWQPILCYGKDPFLAKGMGARNDLIHDRVHTEEKLHPCGKSISFWKKLLLRGSALEGEIIFDPFLGSGTTLLACKMTNRIGLGFELDPNYEEIIKKRAEQYIPVKRLDDIIKEEELC